MSETNNTQAVSAIRKIDDLGRVVIPRFLRDRYGMREWTETELCPTPEGILLRPHFAAKDCAQTTRTIRAVIDADAASYDPGHLANIRRLTDDLAAALDEAAKEARHP